MSYPERVSDITLAQAALQIKRACAIPHGQKDANINLLTCTFDMDPLGGMAHYSAVPIQIEALG